MIELEVNFRTGGNSRRFARKGCSHPEAFGTWLTGEQSSLLLPPPPRDDCKFRLELVVGPFLRRSVVEAQRLSILVNGTEVHAVTIANVQRIVCAIPPGVISAAAPVEIVIVHPDRVRPERLDGYGDRRELAVSIWSLTVFGEVAAGGPPFRDAPAPETGRDPPVFQLRSRGFLANRMIEYMVALSVQSRVPGCVIAGAELPEWDIPAVEAGPDWSDETIVDEQPFDIEALAERMSSGATRKVTFRCYGQNLRYFLPPETYNQVFRPKYPDTRFFGREHLVIHIRAGEIVSGSVRDYVLLPPSFYAELIRETGLSPVFMGQLAPNHYTDALRARFPDALFLEEQDVLRDFELLRRSENVCMAVSTFGWLATWLSNAKRIFMPVNGLLNPQQFPNVDLLPLDDSRYRFYLFPINHAATPERLEEAHRALEGKWLSIDAAELRELAGRSQDQRRVPILP